MYGPTGQIEAQTERLAKMGAALPPSYKRRSQALYSWTQNTRRWELLRQAAEQTLPKQPAEEGMTKERLRQYIDLKREIQSQKERLETMRTQLMYPGQSIGDGMPRSNFAADRTAGKIASVIDLENALRESIKKAQRETVAIEKAIQSLDSSIDRELMRRKYLDGFTWEEVAEALCKSRQWVTVLHGRILIKLKES